MEPWENMAKKTGPAKTAGAITKTADEIVAAWNDLSLDNAAVCEALDATFTALKLKIRNMKAIGSRITAHRAGGAGGEYRAMTKKELAARPGSPEAKKAAPRPKPAPKREAPGATAQRVESPEPDTARSSSGDDGLFTLRVEFNGETREYTGGNRLDVLDQVRERLADSGISKAEFWLGGEVVDPNRVPSGATVSVRRQMQAAA